MEKILDIEMDVTFKIKEEKWSTLFDGIIITTDKQVIKIGIDNQGQCCENWGYFTSVDDVKEFIGSALMDVKTVDETLNVEQLKEKGFYEAGLMFVNIETDRGTLQFTAYNDHNGYYSHQAVIASEEFNHSEYL